MFILASRSQVDVAVGKARNIRPRLSVTTFRRSASGYYGEYHITGQSGDVYAVTCQRNEFGRKLVHCDCRAGERGRVCYHAAAAAGVHIALAANPAHPLRQAAERRNNVLAFPISQRKAA